MFPSSRGYAPILVLALGSLALLKGAGASAADTPDSSAAAPEGGTLQEIVVTAEKRSESLSKVPMSITALDPVTLDEQGVKDIADVARLVPGLELRANTGDYLGDPAISIRGITSNAGASTTGIYIDETPVQARNIYLTTSSAYPKVFDLERIEVLRGPQGTLFGAGSEGGTIRFITPTPSLSEFSGFTHADFATTDGGAPSEEIGAAVGGPLINGTLGFRVSAWYRRDGGYIDRYSPQTGALLDGNSNHGETKVARFAMRWAVSDSLTVTPAMFFQSIGQHDQDGYWESAGLFNATYALPSPVTDRFVLPSLDVQYDTSLFSIKSISSYFDRSSVRFADATAFDLSGLLPGGAIAIPGDPGYIANSYYRNAQLNWTQELRFTSNSGPKDRFAWVAGLFYQHNSQLLDDWYAEPLGQVTGYLASLPPNLANPNVCQDPGTGLSYGPTVADCFGVDLLNGIYSGIQHEVEHEVDRSFFGNLDYRITDQLTVKVGVRVSHSSFDFADHQDGPYTGGPLDTGGSQSQTSVTPRFSLSYQITDDTMVYTTAAKGYRIGGANESLAGNPACAGDLALLHLTDAPLQYDSDSVWSYELGSKGRFFQNSLSVDASVFWIEWSAIQQQVLLPTCGYTFVDNLGHARSRGFDLQTDWAATKDVTLSATVGLTDAVYTETVGNPILALDGDHLPTPEWTATFAALRHFSAFGHEAYARADYQYSGPYDRTGSAATFSYDPETRHQVATNFVTARTGATFDKVEVAAYCNNVLNSHTSLFRYHDTVDSPGFRDFTFRPRTLGMSFDYRF